MRMIDLTNKTTDELNALIQKYASILETIKPKDQPYLAVVIDVAYRYLTEKYPNLSPDWKAWNVVALKLQLDKIRYESDIANMIDDFIEYYTKGHQNHVSNSVAVSEYDRDFAFVHSYTHKKNR